ncbi:hypothetical protein BASA81_000839 [Batrachochytrium salamandrivorans]|nr:hypothetical protein BASA81_000839 [Batrachochytrium salamandrivorans]
MPLRLDIRKRLSTRTDRVKSVDICVSEPWVLIGLYTGHLQIWNYETQQMIKSFEVADQTPIRFAKFIARKQWIVCGSDDMLIRVFNLNTMEKLREFEAHVDYIRSLEVHPTQPYVLTSSDDMQIKMWDWEKQWQNVQSFDGHSHYVMMVKFNPKDSNTFASASLDKSVKIWSLGSSLPNFSLEGHQAGVNCVDYFQGGDKPYIASGSDDFTVKIWDYQTKACVHTLANHTNNVSAVVFHPTLPIILSGSEDGTIRVWHSTTYRLENTLNYGLERCWTLGVSQFSNKVAAGFDEGIVVLQMGREMPVVSMDKSGKLLLATAKDIQAGALRSVNEGEIVDGEMIEIGFKSAGPVEVHLQTLEHNANGRFVVACGDGEYVVYTSQALRNKSFGQALDFGWSKRSPNDYCVRDQMNKIHLFNDFKETTTFTFANGSAEGLFGGHLVGVTNQDSITFFTWTGGKEVYKIDVCPKQVFWSEEGDHLCLACEESFFILSCNLEACESGLQSDACFEYLDEIPEFAKTGQWVGDCFIYTNANNRLNYYVGGEVVTLAHLDRECQLLGFLKNRLFLMDKTRNVFSYQVLESVLRYQTAVVRQDFQLANELLAEVPKTHHGKIARFLEAKGFKEAAMSVATDPEHKFELALQLERFSVALQLMRTELVGAPGANAEDIQAKWKQLGDLALARGNVTLATECAENGNDFASLLLIHSSTANVQGLRALYRKADAEGFSNIAFCAALLLRDYGLCVDVLKRAKRTPEACFMALNYCPSKVGELCQEWKQELKESGHGLSLRIANALADPSEFPELFPGIAEALQRELAYKAYLNNEPIKRPQAQTEMQREEEVKRPVAMAAVAAVAVQPEEEDEPVEEELDLDSEEEEEAPVVAAAVVAAPAAPVVEEEEELDLDSEEQEVQVEEEEEQEAPIEEEEEEEIVFSEDDAEPPVVTAPVADKPQEPVAAAQEDEEEEEEEDFLGGDDDGEEGDIGLEEDWA